MRLGEEETRESWSCVDGVVTTVVVIEGAGGCDGGLVTAGVRFVSVDVAVVVVVVVGCEAVLFVCCVAPAAAAEYRIGVNVGGRDCWGRPTFRMLDIGCCAKFGGGGGFAGEASWSVGAVKQCREFIHSEAIEGSGITITPIRLRLNRTRFTHFSVRLRVPSSIQDCHPVC